MDTREKFAKSGSIAGTLVPEDFDLRKESGYQRLPPQLHDGTGQAWVSSLRAPTGDDGFEVGWSFGREWVLDDLNRGYHSIRPDAPDLCEKTLARWLMRPEGAAIHRVGNFPITHPNTSEALGVVIAINYATTQF